MRLAFSAAHRPARIRFTNSLRLAAEDIVVAFGRWRERRAHLRQLKALLERDDHLLRDMGADRLELRAEIAGRRRRR